MRLIYTKAKTKNKVFAHIAAPTNQKTMMMGDSWHHHKSYRTEAKDLLIKFITHLSKVVHIYMSRVKFKTDLSNLCSKYLEINREKIKTAGQFW